MALQPGTRLGPYEVAALIGAGGMGEVYQARDTRLDRTVAIKVLPDWVADDADARARFEREARAVAALNHPHICTLYDVGSSMARTTSSWNLDGQTLAARPKGRCRSTRALEIRLTDRRRARQGAPAGHHASGPEARQHHGDEDGLKLLDFGLAKLRRRAGPISMSCAGDALATATPRHGARHDSRDGAVHGPRAGRGQAGRCAQRHLLVRRSCCTRCSRANARSTATNPASVIAAILERDAPVGGRRGTAFARPRAPEVPRQGSGGAMAVGAGYQSRARDDQRCACRHGKCGHEALDAGGRLAGRIPHGVGDRRGALDDMASTSGRTTSSELPSHTPCRYRVPVLPEWRRKRHLSRWPKRRIRGGHERDASAVDSGPRFAHRPRASRH